MKAFPRRRAFFSFIGLVGALVFVLPGADAAVRTWDGGGTDGFWTTAANWSTDVAPVAGDDLVFPAGAARLINTNNFSLGTLFNSITLSGGNYTLNGSTILLNAGVDASSATGPNAVHVPLTLNSNQS